MTSPPSPCVRNCTLNEQDVCLGCGRTLSDITGWTKMSDDEKTACVARGRETLQHMGRPLPPWPPIETVPIKPRGWR